MQNLPEGWAIEGQTLYRRFELRNFARAMQLANLAGWLGEMRSHHPDIAFGWGYCDIRLTSHEAGGLTKADFAFVQAFDAMSKAGQT
jgi:4a-hydroxytetrahydrobiopterin dehydratase